jgi:hypothetical protein
MVKMYEQNLKRNLNLDEKDLQEVKSIKNISKSDLEKEIKELTESIISKLKPSLNESTDIELNNKIQDTIDRVLNTTISHYDLYKLRKLNEGL